VKKEKLVLGLPDRQVLLDPQDLKEIQGIEVLLVQLEQEPLAKKEIREALVLQDLQELAQPDPRDRLEIEALRDPQAILEIEARLDQQDRKE
jgi:hypothetical protein